MHLHLTSTCLAVLVIAVTITASTGEDQDEEPALLNRSKPPKDDEAVEELKDMLVVSMQSIVSNNDLVTQLTQKVVQNMISIGESKTEMENLQKSHSEEIAKLKEQIEDLKVELRNQIGDVDTELKTLIEEMKSGHSSALAAQTAEIGEELSQIKDKKGVKIVSSEGGLRDEECAKVCAGTTGRRTTTWANFASRGLHTTVDISECGFVTIPTITTSLEGDWLHWRNMGASEVFKATTTSFQTYIYVSESTTLRQRASELLWNMEWIAVGYTC